MAVPPAPAPEFVPIAKSPLVFPGVLELKPVFKPKLPDSKQVGPKELFRLDPKVLATVLGFVSPALPKPVLVKAVFGALPVVLVSKPGIPPKMLLVFDPTTLLGASSVLGCVSNALLKLKAAPVPKPVPALAPKGISTPLVMLVEKPGLPPKILLLVLAPKAALGAPSVLGFTSLALSKTALPPKAIFVKAVLGAVEKSKLLVALDPNVVLGAPSMFGFVLLAVSREALMPKPSLGAKGLFEVENPKPVFAPEPPNGLPPEVNTEELKPEPTGLSLKLELFT